MLLYTLRYVHIQQSQLEILYILYIFIVVDAVTKCPDKLTRFRNDHLWSLSSPNGNYSRMTMQFSSMNKLFHEVCL